MVSISYHRRIDVYNSYVSTIASMSASQQASANHKVHVASTWVDATAVHHKAHTVHVVDPQAHGSPDVAAMTFDV